MPKALFGITLFFAAGIWLAASWLLSPKPLWLGELFLGIAALYAVVRKREYVLPLVLGLFFVAGMLRFIELDKLPQDDISLWAGQTVTVQGRISQMPQWGEVDFRRVGVKYVVDVNQVTVNGASYKASGGIAVTLEQRTATERASYGDDVNITGKITLPANYRNPGLLDTATGFHLQGISAKMSVKPGNLAYSPTHDKSWRALLATGREQAIGTIRQAMSAQDAAVLSGVLFGGTFGIDKQVVKDFSATGLIHILSVSGTHIVLVAGAIAWLCARLGLGQKKTAFMSSVGLVGYALFAGLSAPVVRSVIMGLLSVAALGLGREKNAFQALVMAALIMLMYQPVQLFDISFQLSFGASAGLILLYGKTADKLAFLPKWLKGPVSVTLAAQLGVLPFIAWYFHSFPLISFVANIVVLPIIEVVVVVGLLGVLIAPVWLVGGKMLLVGCALLLGTAERLTVALASLKGTSVFLPTIGVTAGALYYLLLLWIYRYLPHPVPSPAAILQRWPKQAAALSIAIVICLEVYCDYPRPVQVHFIDVGQGDATLITTPHGRAVLIDCGESNPITGFDAGERIVSPYLQHYGVKSVDYLILTSGQMEDAGGSVGLVTTLPVKNILVPESGETKAAAKLKRNVSGSRVISAVLGEQVQLDGVTFTVVYTPEKEKSQGSTSSNSILVRYGQQSFLIMGDAGMEADEILVSSGLEPGSVLKVARHGAKTSTTRQLLQTFSPEYAVISVGNNTFGYPHSEMLARLKEKEIKILRTDRDGAIVFTTDGTKLSAEIFVKQ